MFSLVLADYTSALVEDGCSYVENDTKDARLHALMELQSGRTAVDYI